MTGTFPDATCILLYPFASLLITLSQPLSMPQNPIPSPSLLHQAPLLKAPALPALERDVAQHGRDDHGDEKSLAAAGERWGAGVWGGD